MGYAGGLVKHVSRMARLIHGQQHAKAHGTRAVPCNGERKDWRDFQQMQKLEARSDRGNVSSWTSAATHYLRHLRH